MVDGSGRTSVTAPGSTRGRVAAAQVLRGGDELGGAELLIQLSRVVQAVHGRVAEDHGLTRAQARMVCILAFGPRGMAELARGLGVEKATLTGIADRAEQRELITRVPVPGDRRACNVELTATGVRKAAEFHADAVARLNGLLSPLSSSELARFRGATVKVLDATADDAPAGIRGQSPGHNRAEFDHERV